jgi:hypothetical protein
MFRVFAIIIISLFWLNCFDSTAPLIQQSGPGALLTNGAGGTPRLEEVPSVVGFGLTRGCETSRVALSLVGLYFRA